MPRLPTSLLREAYTIDRLLPALLGPCRDLRAARNELRWLREHVNTIAAARPARGGTLAKDALLRDLVRQRASGKPLQYILGTEYFGELEIMCRPGVLIPRQDTAASISHLVCSIRNAQSLPSELRVLDLCTGTGCIPLLFHHEFYSARDDIDLRILGVDVSDTSLNLAAHNLKRMRKDKSWAEKGAIGFMKADVLLNPFADQKGGRLPLKRAFETNKQLQSWDILISNPPYISPSAYWKTTTRSVRGFEPKLALVPPPHSTTADTERGDTFYQPLLHIARDVEAKIVLLEIADLEQALRVARMARELRIFDGIEIWRDQPEQTPDTTPSSTQGGFSILGQGNARSVLCWRGAVASWLGKPTPGISLDDDAHRLLKSHGNFTSSFHTNGLSI